jgi:hypothetical protein
MPQTQGAAPSETEAAVAPETEIAP